MKWILYKDKQPEEYEDVLIYGAFNSNYHYREVKAAHWKQCGERERLWFNPGTQYYENHIAYDHEVFYWMPYPEEPCICKFEDYKKYATSDHCCRCQKHEENE